MPSLTRTKSIAELISASEAHSGQLRRHLGLWSLVALGIGSVIGAGIFAFTGTAAAGTSDRPGAGPGIYSNITLDQNDGLIVIEPNDYQQGNTNLVIVGAQIAGSDEGLSGTALDFTYGGVLGVASTGTQSFATDVNDGPFKISSIGFTTSSASCMR